MFVVHTAPDPPVLQSAVSSNSQSLVVSWLSLDCGSINSEGVDQYIIRYGNADIGDFQANVPTPETSTTISNAQLKPFTEYILALAAISSVGISNYSSFIIGVILRGIDSFLISFVNLLLIVLILIFYYDLKTH